MAADPPAPPPADAADPLDAIVAEAVNYAMADIRADSVARPALDFAIRAAILADREQRAEASVGPQITDEMMGAFRAGRYALAERLVIVTTERAAALARAEAAEARLAQLTAATQATFHDNGVITFAPPNPEPFEVALADELARRLAAEARLAAVEAERDRLANVLENLYGLFGAALDAARPATEDGDAP